MKRDARSAALAQACHRQMCQFLGLYPRTGEGIHRKSKKKRKRKKRRGNSVHSRAKSGGRFLPASRLESCPYWGSLTEPVVIYALVDPRDQTVRYIGITSKSLEQRLNEHLRSPSNHRTARWFGQLRASGQTPLIQGLASASYKDWEALEIRWIAWVKLWADLLNVDPGGRCRDKEGKMIPGKLDLARKLAATVMG